MYPSNMKAIPHLHIQKHLLSQDIRMLFFFCLSHHPFFSLFTSFPPLSLTNLLFRILFCVLKDQETSYTIVKSKESEIVVDGLKPSSAYIFQIRARTSAGYGGFSRRFEFETSLYCKSQYLIKHCFATLPNMGGRNSYYCGGELVALFIYIYIYYM